MQIPPIGSSATAKTQQEESSQTNAKPKKEFKADSFMYDMVNIKNKNTNEKIAIGLLTVGSAIAGFRSAKGFLMKAINTVVMAVVGFAAGIGITDAANKYQKTAKKDSTEPPKTETKAETKAETKPEEKPEEKPEAKAENEVKSDDKKDN